MKMVFDIADRSRLPWRFHAAVEVLRALG